MSDTQPPGLLGFLPPFNAAAMCPKCLHDEVTTTYKRDAHCSSYMDRCQVERTQREPECCNREKSEHLHRSCQRCHYWWPERVLDSGEAQGGNDG